MAVKENPFQTEMVTAFKACRFHAFKASHAYSTGILDLYVRCPDDACYVECKFIKPISNFGHQSVSMTMKQFLFAKSEMEAGGPAGFVIGYKWGGNHGLFVCDPKQRTALVRRSWMESDSRSHIRRTRGQPWDGSRIMSAILGVSNKTVDPMNEIVE